MHGTFNLSMWLIKLLFEWEAQLPLLGGGWQGNALSLVDNEEINMANGYSEIIKYLYSGKYEYNNYVVTCEMDVFLAGIGLHHPPWALIYLIWSLSIKNIQDDIPWCVLLKMTWKMISQIKKAKDKLELLKKDFESNCLRHSRTKIELLG